MNKYVSVSIIALLFLSTICFIQIKSVQATTTYLSDTFESFTTGWTIGSGLGGLIAKSGEQYHGGSYSAVVNSTIVANYGYAYKAVSSTPKSDYHIDEWVYPSSAISAINLFLGGCYNTTTSNYNFIMGLNCSGGAFYLVNCLVDSVPGTWENVGSMSNNSWHHIEAYFIKSTTKIHYYVDSVKQGGDWASLNNVFPERFYFGDTSATARMGKCFYDDLTIDDVAEPISDSTPPTYSNIGYNETMISNPCKFSCLWADETALSGYIFGTNNTGTFTNETWTSLSGVSAWANVTKILNGTTGNKIQFEWWCNDTSNNWNNTGLQIFTTTSWTVTFTLNYWGQRTCYVVFGYNGTFLANGTSLVFNNSTTTLRLEAFSWSWSDGNLFDGWYLNGGSIRAEDPLLGYLNPINLLINKTYSIILNYTESTLIIPRFYVQNGTLQTNETIGFNASPSWAFYGIYSYSWDWNDSTSDLWQTSPTILHTFHVAGTYNVTLTVTDTSFMMYSTSITIPMIISDAPDTSWYIAPGFILGFVCFLGVGFVLVKKKHD